MPVLSTQQDLLDALRRLLDEPGESQYDDVTLKAWINAACEAVALELEVVVKMLNISWTASTVSYTLANATDLIRIEKASYYEGSQTTYYPIEVVADTQMAEYYGQLIEQTGAPKVCYIAPQTSASATRSIALWPVPSVTGTLRLTYTAMPTVLTATTNTTELPGPYREYAVQEAYIRGLKSRNRREEAAQERAELDRIYAHIRLKPYTEANSGLDKIFDYNGNSFI